ncbi:BREX-1 system phosphatase PglZ type B [Haliscomenobacter hydrossis]|uniref:PglZ domain protein n=1 Tax=Haliscomenobacter hydrossis (strain ATCC 27775 / DSM 1100 / LMG 10767 / O) TaxID=760192 RepID=F4L7Z2_HALH1|nr:BREX-1 system phosphatase PglZ type B [Haliscomenobacter hydrossis]AEE54500.1 PglZ domain protein [Haliscomenobacter hydrossis DSM 1100]
MSLSLYDKVLQALKQAENHNSNVMVRPEVILWPDPDHQWLEVIPVLQASLPHLLRYGSYVPAQQQGPAIWLKCMVARMLPAANWDSSIIPIIYLPGVSKNDLRNVEQAVFDFQPLLEYQYTGTLFVQENGKEWTILAFVENPFSGLGLKVAKDSATKDALKKTLPTIFQDAQALSGKALIDADHLNKQVFPDIIPAILTWMCQGDRFLHSLEPGKREVFKLLCRSAYDFEPDHRNISAITEKLGAQKSAWKYVWQLYAAAPHKYPELEALLRLAKPADLGKGPAALPAESWPQVNEEAEEALAQALLKAASLDAPAAMAALHSLEKKHLPRLNWVWFELGKAPLAAALPYLVQLAFKVTVPFSTSSIEAMKTYYTDSGYLIDQSMRKALVGVKSERDKGIVKSLIQLFYRPWLENLTLKFQKLVAADASIFTTQTAQPEQESFVLFVDAFRYELAVEFAQRLAKTQCQVSLQANWSAIPSLTPTAKPSVSPIATAVSTQSGITEFRPHLQNGKDLLTAAFRDALKNQDVKYITNASEIQGPGKYWQEIGDIDTKGHEEQSGMVKRVEELFEGIEEVLALAFEKGITRIKIVTDHGWLLLPGGLPKVQLNAGLTETRWGRCALIKEGVNTDLLHLPWRWNPATFIAYAPGIAFFKANEEYAHGGISLHECLIPTLMVEQTQSATASAKISDIKWVNLKCNVTTAHASDQFTIDIRTKYNDEHTSIVESTRRNLKDNKGVLMVSDDADTKAATVVLLDETGRILDKKVTIVGG